MKINNSGNIRDVFNCYYCPLGCKLSNNKVGLCNTYLLKNGNLFYNPLGKYYLLRRTTMESIGLYHFWPGHKILTIHIGNIKLKSDLMSFMSETGELIELLNKSENKDILKGEEIGIFISGFEPLHDFLIVQKLIEDSKHMKALVCIETSGFLSFDIMKDVFTEIDALIFNFMGFNDISYRKIFPILNGFNQTFQVFESILDKVSHVEVFYHVINGINTDTEGFRKFIKRIIDSAGFDIPLHIVRSNFSRIIGRRFSTNREMERLWKVAKGEGLNFVYINGYYQSPKNYTICPNNNKVIIEHLGHWIRVRWENLTEECYNAINIKGKIKENFPPHKVQKNGEI